MGHLSDEIDLHFDYVFADVGTFLYFLDELVSGEVPMFTDRKTDVWGHGQKPLFH